MRGLPWLDSRMLTGMVHSFLQCGCAPWEGMSLHVSNLDVKECGVANDLDGRAIHLTWQTQAKAKVQEVAACTKGSRVICACACACGKYKWQMGNISASVAGALHTSLLVMTCARKMSAMFLSKPSR